MMGGFKVLLKSINDLSCQFSIYWLSSPFIPISHRMQLRTNAWVRINDDLSLNIFVNFAFFENCTQFCSSNKVFGATSLNGK